MRHVEAPRERSGERVERCLRRVDAAEVAHHRDPERARVEPACMRAHDVPVDSAGATFVDRPETVDERVVADVVPAVALDVVELDRPNDSGRLEPRVRVRPCRVMDVRHAQRVCVGRLTPDDRLVGEPAAARDELRRAGRRRRPQRHLGHGAAHRQRASPGHVAVRPHLELDRAADPDRGPDPPSGAALELCAAAVRRVVVAFMHRAPSATTSRRPTACAPRGFPIPSSGCPRGGMASSRESR